MRAIVLSSLLVVSALVAACGPARALPAAPLDTIGPGGPASPPPLTPAATATPAISGAAAFDTIVSGGGVRSGGVPAPALVAADSAGRLN